MSASSMKIEKLKMRKRCPLFYARDFKSLMYPCFLFCFILGIFPYKVESSNYVSSRIRFIFSTITIVVYFCYSLTVFYQIDISHTLEYDSIPGLLQVNFYHFLGGVITVVTYIFTKPRLQALQNVSEVSSRLPPKSFDKMAKWIHAKDIIGFLFLASHLLNIINSNVSESLSKILCLYTTMVVFLMDMFYMNCVCALKACFERINENLMNLRKVLITDEPHLLRRVYHEQKNPLLLFELRALKKRHLQISDVVQMVNSTFSMQIIATVVLTFAEVTFSLYFYILQQQGQKEINLEKQIWFAYFLPSVAYFSIKLTLIVWACDTGKGQALQIGTNIHEVLLNTFDKQIKDELELFSLQVLHRDNVFLAKGLTIDATLLTKIVGGITTYLLILIQFLLSTVPCVEKEHDV